MTISGNYTALVTPFKRNGNVDYETLKNLIDFQLDNGTDGLVILGATGEAHLLDSYEKRKIMQTAVNQVNGKVPIIAGITATKTEDAILEARSRFIDGADAVLVCTPSYIKPTQTGLYKYFLSIAENSYVPIIIYNNPSRTGVNLEPKTIQKLSLHPNIIGLKEANSNFSHIVKVSSFISKDFTLICGNDEFLLPLLSLGATASISVVGNIMPDLVHDVIETYTISPTDALEIYNHFQPILESLSSSTKPVTIKYMMQQLGMIKANFRAPLCKPDSAVKRKIRQSIEKMLKL